MSAAEVNHVEATIRTVYETILSTTAEEVIQVYWSCARTKEGIGVGSCTCEMNNNLYRNTVMVPIGIVLLLTCGSISQLSAGNIGIKR